MENRTDTVVISAAGDSQISPRHATRGKCNIAILLVLLAMAVQLAYQPARCQETASPPAAEKPRAYSGEAIKHYNRGLEFHQS